MNLIPDWRQAWRYYSVMFYGVLLASPELYQAAVSFDLLRDAPDNFSFVVRAVAFAGLVARFIDQKKPEPKPE